MKADQPSRALLGQVFTPPDIADLIAGLCILRPEATVFDPCAGEGALLLAAGRRLAALGATDWQRQVHGVELDAAAWATGRERLAAAAGVTPEQIAVRQGDFLAPAPEPERTVYDVAVINPPYTRQELLSPARKQHAGLSRRAGLHAHFLVALARCVRPGGYLGAITTATWLAAAYGRELRQFLLRQFRIRLLIAFERDLFANANVEACLALLEKRDPDAAPAESRVRFVTLRHRHDAARAVAEAARREQSGEGCGYRVVVVPQEQLSADERWSRYFLALPDRLRPAATAPLVPLEMLARIRRGITTGANRVFLPDAETIRRYGIEARHLHPIVVSPRALVGLDTAEIDAPARLLVPPTSEETHSRAAAYLAERGEERFAARRQPLPAPAPLLFGYAIRGRKAFFLNSARLLAGDNFFCLTPRREADRLLLFALLNAAPTALALELAGRGQGSGLLKVQRYELAALRLPDPEQMDAGLRRELEALAEALRQSPAAEAVRAALDQAAARALGLDGAAIRTAERELAARRQARRQVGSG